MSNWPFSADVPKNQWTEIQADGFAGAVPGCVYDGHRLDGGIPLGGLGTGYFTLEGSGLIGHCSIFNDIVPPRADFSEWLTVKIARRGEPAALQRRTSPTGDTIPSPIWSVNLRRANRLELGIRAFCSADSGQQRRQQYPCGICSRLKSAIASADDIDLELILRATAGANSGSTHDVTLMGEDINVVNNDGQLVGRFARTIEGEGIESRSICLRLVFAELERQQLGSPCAPIQHALREFRRGCSGCPETLRRLVTKCAGLAERYLQR